MRTSWLYTFSKQVGLLLEAKCAAAHISFGKNITAISVHLTSLYLTALTSAKGSFHCFTSLCKCKIMRHLGVNFGGIWRLELGFFIWAYLFFLRKKFGLIFKSPMTTLHCCPPEGYAMCSVSINVQCQYLSVLIRDHVMHPNIIAYGSFKLWEYAFSNFLAPVTLNLTR